MTLETVIAAALAGAGFVFMVCSSSMAKALERLTNFVFRFPCRLWPDLQVAVDVVFGTPRIKLFVRLLGAIYLVSGAILLIFVLLAGVE